MSRVIKGCGFCVHDGECAYPCYGLAPHNHVDKGAGFIGSTEFTGDTQDNFEPEEGCTTHGTYTHCPKCGYDGS